MPFTPFDRRPGYAKRKQGPPKLVVSQAPAGRTTIHISGAVRDHLNPTLTPKVNGFVSKSMRVRLLVDTETRRVALQRVEDADTGRETYEVRGLDSSGNAYISDWGLDESLGLTPGHYPAQLTAMAGEPPTPAAIICLDERIETKKKSLDQKAIIEAIINEGVEIV